jgi:hypothetical protein
MRARPLLQRSKSLRPCWTHSRSHPIGHAERCAHLCVLTTPAVSVPASAHQSFLFADDFMTILHLVASTITPLLDLAAAIACARNGLLAHDGKVATPDRRWWLLIALAFAGYAVFGLSGAEYKLQAAMRGALMQDGDYSWRRDLQIPITIAAILLIAGAGAVVIWRLQHVPRQYRYAPHGIAALAVMALSGVTILRLISLHAIDKLLFGPLKINWVIEFGAACLAITVALHHRRTVRQFLRHRRHRR